MPNTAPQEHRLIAEFARTNIFPALDQFAADNELECSVDSGLLILLAQRLIYEGGFAPENIEKLVRSSIARMRAASSPQPATKPAPKQIPTGVIQFPTRA